MGRTGRYVCLSYCWGQSEFTVTTRGNLKDHLERGIELKGLPRTFQDAVEVARGLQVRYLWIDALCIIQNEDNHEDWKRECDNMASIYRNSYVTIAAAWANAANGGCFTAPDPGVANGPIMMRKVPHFPSTAIRGESADFPIFTRAWTYQERLLAPRVIYFGRQEILWDCISRRTCECGGAAYTRLRVAKFDFHNQTAIEDSRLWRRLIMQYATLQLTCSNDKLPALSGLAQAMKFRSQENYMAGLWKDTLLVDMCWYKYPPREKEPHQPKWRAPSWSWASVDAPIRWYPGLCFGSALRIDELAQVCEANCTLAGPSLTGKVKDGFVTLGGFLIPASLEANGIHTNCSELECLQLGWFPDRTYGVGEIIDIYLIPMVMLDGCFHGLVVKPYGQGTEMSRLGLAIRRGEFWVDPFHFPGLEKQVVRIV